MAIVRFDCKGFGQIEPNQTWFTRAGKSESQCALDPEYFVANFPAKPEEVTDGLIYAENGAFLAIDKAKGLATLPSAATDETGCPIGIHYSTEKIYNQLTPGRRNFALVRNEFLPRIGFVDVGERFTTNTVSWDTESAIFVTANPNEDSTIMYGDIKTALAGGTDVYAYVIEGSEGRLVVGASVDDAIGGVYTKIVKAYTNADGTKAFMFQVINKPTA